MREPSLGWAIPQTALIFKPSQQCKTPLSLPALPSFSLSPPWTSFLLINALFLPTIQICPATFQILFLLFGFLAPLWKQWKRGHLFPPGSYMLCTHTTRRQRVCGLAGASWRGRGGGEGVNSDSCWTLPPSVTPVLPAAWRVVASGAHCLCSADKRWKSDGTFQNLPPPPPQLKIWNLWPNCKWVHKRVCQEWGSSGSEMCATVSQCY